MNLTLENKIFQKIKDGDERAFRLLFHKYFQSLYLFALKFVDEEQAKDFIQDIFCELWNNRKKIEINTSISAYLFTVVKNRCFTYLKRERKKHEQQNVYAIKLKEEELLYYDSSEKSILEFAINDRISKVIERLPEKCSEVFKDSRFKGHSNKEIARIHNISIKAVEKHITKALQLFRDEFKDILLILAFLLISKF